MSAEYVKRIEAGWVQFRRGALDKLLRSLQNTALKLINQRGTGHLPVGMQEMDFLLEACGAKIAGKYIGQKFNEPSGELVVATQIYADGGHTALVGDLVSACPAGTVRLCLPNPPVNEDAVPPGALERTGLAYENLIRIPGDSPTERICSALEACLVHPPARIHLIHHMHDVEAVVFAEALARITDAGIYMFHHADYLPTVGLYCKRARLIELTERTAAFTRYGLGLSNHYLPLTCKDPGVVRKTFLRNGPVTTGMAVTAAKLFVQGLCGYDYVSVIAWLLKHTSGTHFHIGDLPPAKLAAIRAELKAAGVSADRFQAVGTCASVPLMMAERGVDVMLNSFPLAGARTSVECMASGVPMLWHGQYSGNNMRRSRMAYPGALNWFHPDDLVKTILHVDADWCLKQGTMARSHWERTHAPENWQRFFQDPDGFNIRLNEELTRELVQVWLADFSFNRELDRALVEANAGIIARLQGYRGRISRLKFRIVSSRRNRGRRIHHRSTDTRTCV